MFDFQQEQFTGLSNKGSSVIIGESRQVVLVITSDDAIEAVISRILKKRKMIITGYHFSSE